MDRIKWDPQECMCSWKDLDALVTFQQRCEIPALLHTQNILWCCCWKNLVRARCGHPQRATIIPFQSKPMGKHQKNGSGSETQMKNPRGCDEGWLHPADGDRSVEYSHLPPTPSFSHHMDPPAGGSKLLAPPLAGQTRLTSPLQLLMATLELRYWSCRWPA